MHKIEVMPWIYDHCLLVGEMIIITLFIPFTFKSPSSPIHKINILALKTFIVIIFNNNINVHPHSIRRTQETLR